MTIIAWNSPALGGMKYPYLDGLKGHIETTPHGDKDEAKRIKTETQDVSLRYVKDDKTVDVKLDDYPKFKDALRMLGLRLSLKKGGFVLSKRLSRLMRPYYFYAFFLDAEVDVFYDPALSSDQWDGAGLVDRAFLEKLSSHLPVHKRSSLTGQLSHAGRVEFTVQSGRGQDKGHALVVDNLGHDLVLPLDTKKEVISTDGRTFVGVQIVHSAQRMWLDVQSLINLYPFLETDPLMTWLHETGQQMLDAIERGDIDRLFEYIPNLEVAEAWPVREYIASGGKAMWFSSVVKSLANQHLKMVRQRSLKKFRLPIPGAGRFYVFSAAVGHKQVPEGFAEFDPQHATVWINETDWRMAAPIWGGADMDDGLWAIFFSDYDGKQKVILWRSPNQLGEYILLEPMGDLSWVTYHELDSRKLPTRIDARTTTYLGLVEDGEYEDKPYSVRAMQKTVNAATRNIASMQQTINLQMVLKALGAFPDELADHLDKIIDAQVKTGASLVGVKRWNRRYARRYFMQHMQVPQALMHRILGLLTREQREWMEPTTDHWFDDLVAKIQTHLWDYAEQRNALAAKAMPPVQVFEYGRNFSREGGILRSVYAHVIEQAQSERPLISADFDAARGASEKYLSHLNPKDWTGVLAGAALHTYVLAENASDAVMWQLGSKLEDGTRQKGIVHITLEMLRKVGVIGDLVETTEGVARYYREDVEVGIPMVLNGTWFAAAQTLLEAQGQPVPAEMGALDKPQRDRYKALVQDWAVKGAFNGQKIQIRDDEWKGKARRSAWRNGHRIGFVQGNAPSNEATPLFAYAQDGNLWLVIA